MPFEGNIEEQALMLHEKCQLKEIPTKADFSDDDDIDFFADKSENDKEPKLEQAVDEKEVLESKDAKTEDDKHPLE